MHIILSALNNKRVVFLGVCCCCVGFCFSSPVLTNDEEKCPMAAASARTLGFPFASIYRLVSALVSRDRFDKL